MARHISLLRKPAKATAEFQKILDHPGVALEDPIGALAWLQLARAHVLASDASAAKRAYEDLFTLWKDADAGLPIVRQAREEYARLP